MSGARNQDTWMNSARDQDSGMGNRQRCEVNGSREMTDTTDLIARLRDNAQGISLGAEGMGWGFDEAMLQEAADALEKQAAQIEAMRAALEWYADEARSCEKNSKVGNYYAGDAILASVTVLALDGGKRADAALRQEQPT